MKIVVTAQSGTPDADVDLRFGRASHFILYDTESGEYTAHSNAQNVNAAQGAGIQAAQQVARMKPDVVITGHVGPKAFDVLKAARIKVCVGATGSVREAVEGYQNGTLADVSQADVEGHWS